MTRRVALLTVALLSAAAPSAFAAILPLSNNASQTREGWTAPSDSSARMIGERVVSTEANEFGGAMSRDGREIYFSRSVPRSYYYAIFESRYHGARWLAPEIVAFSGRYRDFDAQLSADGRVSQ